MNVPVVTFFNNKGGVGKTSLVYHLAWMFAKQGRTVIAADLDPQANLTSAFLTEETIEQLWSSENTAKTIFQAVNPLQEVKDLLLPELQEIEPHLFLLPGDMALSGFEDALSSEWPDSMNSRNLYRPLRILTAFWHIIQNAARGKNADLILMDIGPNLGAINRSALLATDYVIIPLGADLFSLQGLKNLGPTLRNWRKDWGKRRSNWDESLDRNKYPEFALPAGKMEVLGYLIQQHGERMDRPVKAYQRWSERVPKIYRESINEDFTSENIPTLEKDNFCMAMVRHYRSLIPMGQEKRKPIFSLTSADGAIGSHAEAVRSAFKHFEELAQKIGTKVGVPILSQNYDLEL